MMSTANKDMAMIDVTFQREKRNMDQNLLSIMPANMGQLGCLSLLDGLTLSANFRHEPADHAHLHALSQLQLNFIAIEPVVGKARGLSELEPSAADGKPGKLFQAGILPGLLAMTMYMLTIAVICRVRPDFLPTVPKASWQARLAGARAQASLEEWRQWRVAAEEGAVRWAENWQRFCRCRALPGLAPMKPASGLAWLPCCRYMPPHWVRLSAQPWPCICVFCCAR